MRDNDVMVITVSGAISEIGKEMIRSIASTESRNGSLGNSRVLVRFLEQAVEDPVGGMEVVLCELKGRSTKAINRLRAVLIEKDFAVCVDAIIPDCKSDDMNRR